MSVLGRTHVRTFVRVLRYSGIIGVLLVSAVLNSWHLVASDVRLHPDEAFYLTIARRAAVVGDWWLVGEPLDKPPLTFYGNAALLRLVGVDVDTDGVLQLDSRKGEFAGRLLSYLAGLVLVAGVFQLGKQILDWRVGLGAAWLVAVSPFTTQFAATAFTDVPMLGFGVLALAAGAAHRWRWAAILYALAMVAKPQVIVYLPLLGWLAWRNPPTKRQWRDGVLIVGVLVGMVLWWDGQRMGLGAESFYRLGRQNYTVTRWTALDMYGERLSILWERLQYLFGRWWLTWILGGVALLGLRIGAVRVYVLWVMGFIGLHMVLTLNLFDRNLIVVLPMMALCVAAVLIRWRCGWVILILSLGIVNFQAGIGGDRGAHTGIIELAAYLNEKPVATVIYDRWLDWELDYYLGVWTDKRRVYYPTPELLIEGFMALDEVGARYWVVPHVAVGDGDMAAWLGAIEGAGIGIMLDYESARFRVYALHPPD